MSISHRGHHYAKQSDFVKPIFKCWQDPYDATSNPNGYINLGVAESVLMRDVLVEKISEIRLENPVSKDTFGYGDFTGSLKLRESLCHFFQKYMFKTEEVLNPEHCIVYGGCNTILETLGAVVCNPGEHLLLDSPYYLALDMDFGRRFDVNLDNVPLKLESGGVYSVDFDKLREMITSNRKIKGILLVNPHNPTGRIYTDQEIERLFDICLEFNLHLIADEVYSQSIIDPSKEFKSVYHYVCAEQDAERKSKLEKIVHVIYSASKDWCLNGFRLGFFYSRCPQVLASMGAVADMNLVSRDTMLLMENFFSDYEFVDQFIKTNQERLRANVNQLMAYLDNYSDVITYIKPEAGMFLYFKVNEKARGDLDQEHLFEKIMDDAHVMLAQGRFFKDPRTHWYRVCFTALEWKDLKLAFDRVVKVLKPE